MMLFNTTRLEEYKDHDMILLSLTSNSQADDANFASQRWLLESLPKRMIYAHMYGDLLQEETPGQKVLDVGGGYTALTRLLVQQHDYTLLDIMAHDSATALRQIETSIAKNFWDDSDWNDFDVSDCYDLVIANDIFPNVDQRLSIFIDHFLSHCHEMRLSLTYYNTPRWYQVKRTDADEIFHMVAWDGRQIRYVLEGYRDRIASPDFDTLLENPPSLFANQRQVCKVVLRGDI